MSDSKQEQIAKVPDGLACDVKKKEKDPKKVAAGKALAERNKKGREALRREEEREAANTAEKERCESEGGIFSFSNILAVFGIGLTIVSFYREYKSQSKHSQTGLCPATENKTVRLEEPKKVKPTSKQIGME